MTNTWNKLADERKALEAKKNDDEVKKLREENEKLLGEIKDLKLQLEKAKVPSKPAPVAETVAADATVTPEAQK